MNQKQNLKLDQLTKPFFRWSFITFLALFFITLLMQLILWKQYSLEATYVQLKSYFVEDSLANYLELGAICNSLGDNYCAEKYFTQVINIDPNNKLGLANLGLVLAKQKKWKQAEPNLKAYFSLGGSSFDVFYWYGLTVWALDSVDRGLNLVLRSLKINPIHLDAGKKAVSHLLAKQQRSLALSLIGAITRGNPESSSYWNDFLNRKEYIEPATEHTTPTWPLISLNNINFYLPLVFKKNTRLKFFSVFEDAKDNLINLSTLNELLVPVSLESKSKLIIYNDRSLTVYPVVLKNVLIAGVLKDEIKFYTCETCPNIIGKSFLKPYNLEYWSENKINYLKISH